MASDDLYPEMRRHPIDDETAERLLAGAFEPDDAPPGYFQVAALVQAAKAPATAEELVRRDADVFAMTAELATPAAASVQREGTRMISRRFATRALAVAIPALALTATGAAAATDSLPAPAQSVVHSALANVGLSVPTGDKSSDENGDAGPHTANNTNAVGPNASGAAKFGLCRAFMASKGHPSTNSVAFRNLKNAAGSEGVAAFCANVTPGNGTSSNTGTSDSTDNGTPNSGGAPSSGPEEPPSSVPAGPPTSTPGSDHTSTSTPAGPPTSTPGSDHTPTSTPAGPPASTPAGKP